MASTEKPIMDERFNIIIEQTVRLKRVVEVYQSVKSANGIGKKWCSKYVSISNGSAQDNEGLLDY